MYTHVQDDLSNIKKKTVDLQNRLLTSQQTKITQEHAATQCGGHRGICNACLLSNATSQKKPENSYTFHSVAGNMSRIYKKPRPCGLPFENQK